MKVYYLQLMLSFGLFGVVMSVSANSTFKVELGPKTVTELSQVSKEAIHQASKEAIQSADITPFLKQFDKFATPKRALRYGSLLALMVGIPYSSRLAWNVLEKKLLNLNHANHLGISDSIIHYGSILTLLLIMPYEGRFLWDMIQKKFFKSDSTSVEQSQPQ